MALYELKYFPINGRVGGIRLLLDYLKVPFNDVHVNPANWMAEKPKTPFGTLPVLTIYREKLELGQTLAIYRYIANKHGAQPASLEEQALVDCYAMVIQEGADKFGAFIGAQKMGLPEAKVKELHQEAIKYLMEREVPVLTKQLERNRTSFLVGSSVTWLDFMCADMVDTSLQHTPPDQQAPFALLKAHRDRIFALPGLEARLKERQQLNAAMASNK